VSGKNWRLFKYRKRAVIRNQEPRHTRKRNDAGTPRETSPNHERKMLDPSWTFKYFSRLRTSAAEEQTVSHYKFTRRARLALGRVVRENAF
jgi:hypothetical protein